MNSLIDTFASLTLSATTQNLEYVGTDPFHGSAQPFKIDPNDWAAQLLVFVTSVICFHAYLFPIRTVTSALFGYKRSKVTPQKAEEFFFRYDVPKHEIVKDTHYYKALDIVTEWFRPNWKIHPVHFTDL